MNVRKKYIILLIFTLFIISSPLLSAEPVKIDTSLESIPLGLHIEYLEDKGGRLGIGDITQKQYEGKWKLSKKKKPGFGLTKSAYWIRFSLENTTDKEINLYLEQAQPLIDYLTLYKPGNEKYIAIETGDMLPYNSRPADFRTLMFPLKIREKSTGQYYMRYSTQGSMNIELLAWNPASFQKKAEKELRYFFMFYAVIAIMIIYNLILFFIVRRSVYIYYVLSLIVGTLFFMSMYGMSYQLFWPDSPWWNNFSTPIFLALTFIFLDLFAIELADVRELKDKTSFRLLLYRLMMTLLGFGVANFIATLFLPYRIAITLGAMLVILLFTVFVIFGSVLIVQERNRGAIFGLIAGSFLITGTTTFTLKAYGVLPSNAFTEWSPNIGIVLMVMLFSIALADRINTLRKDLAALNETLEEKVEHRTEELQAAMEEMEAMNDTILETFGILEEAQRVAVKDMDMAANVQSTLFPKEPPVTNDWEIAFTFKPKSGVSGDLYDFYFSGNELKGISLFDVSGHGIASGLITMIARSVFHRNFMSGHGKKLNEILQGANSDLINEIGDVDNYLAGILLRFEKDEVEYVNAGHSDLLYKSADSGDVKEINYEDRDFKGMFLGIKAVDAPYESLKFKISKSDILFLFTDCIYEAKNSDGKEYGMDKLVDSIKNAPDGSADNIRDHIINEFNSFMDDAIPEDDLTFIVVKRK